jgi:signal transduction histidine kinase
LLLQKARRVVEKRNNDSLKRNYFTELSWAYRGIRDSLMFRNANKLVILLSRQANDTLSEAGSHWDLGSFLRRNSVQDSAYYHYSEAQKKFNSLGENFLSGRMYYNMALVQTEVKDYTGAEINAFKAIGLLKPLEKNLHIYRCYNILGSISKELKEYDRALEYLNQAREYLFKIDDITSRDTYYAFLLNNIGNVYKDQGDYSNATNYYKSALESNDSLQQKNPIIYAQLLTNLSVSRFKAGDTLNVFRDLTTGKQIKFEEGDMAGLSLSHYAFAEYYLSQNDTSKAVENAKLSKQFAQESTNNKRLLASLGLLAQIDSKNSLAFTQQYINLNDDLIGEERQARNKFTRIRFETDEFIAENEVLTRKKQIWTGIALIVFTLGLAVYIIINQRAKNQALRFQQQQQASNQEIFDLMLSQKQKIEDTKKMEQKRISEELHDGVLGKMLGARMVLTGLNKRTNEEAVEERAIAISALKDVEGEVRAISHELSHAAYQNINNFITSLIDLLQSVGNANGIEHDFDYDKSFDWDSMKGDMKINLYRIIQETLQNAVKHSACKKILVNFVRTNKLLIVTIADDGKGFKAKSGKKGIGMRNIESRVGKLNGTWDINSVVDKGTTITFNIPLMDYIEHPKISVEEQVLK